MLDLAWTMRVVEFGEMLDQFIDQEDGLFIGSEEVDDLIASSRDR